MAVTLAVTAVTLAVKGISALVKNAKARRANAQQRRVSDLAGFIEGAATLGIQPTDYLEVWRYILMTDPSHVLARSKEEFSWAVGGFEDYLHEAQPTHLVMSSEGRQAIEQGFTDWYNQYMAGKSQEQWKETATNYINSRYNISVVTDPTTGATTVVNTDSGDSTTTTSDSATGGVTMSGIINSKSTWYVVGAVVLMLILSRLLKQR